MDISNLIGLHNADCVITIGGGSISDACKLATICHANDCRSLDDFEPLRAVFDPQNGRLGLPPGKDIKAPLASVICIPTSLSAGEYNGLAGGTDPRTQRKYPFMHPNCTPKLIICDPYLAKDTPEWVWLSTGLRSVDHAVETIASFQSTPDALDAATDGLGLLLKGLWQCKKVADDVDARTLCQLGAWKASYAIVSGVPMGGSHAIGHALGYTANVPHGYTSCVMLPSVLRFNRQVNEKQQQRIEDVFKDQRIFSDLGFKEEDVLTAADMLRAFIMALGLPYRLQDVNVNPDMYDIVAERTLGDFWAQTNPIPLKSKDAVLSILQQASS